MNPRRITIESSDRELTELLRMWLGDAGYETSGDSAQRIIDTATQGEGSQDAGALYIVSERGHHLNELLRPFSHSELTAAVRRAFPGENGELVVDPVVRRVTYRGDSVSLTGKEYAVMRMLYERGEAGASRDEISAVARREGGERDTNAGDVYVHHLRRKLAALTGEPGDAIIRTVRGFGYALIMK